MYINETLFCGTPENASERAEIEQNTYKFLDSLGIEFYRVDHEHADTIELCHDIEKILGCEICKNLFLCNRQQTDFYLLLTAGDKRFKTSVVSKLIGTSRLSFATADRMMEFFGITPGSMSIFGLMNDKEKKVRLLIDKCVLDEEFFGAHPCKNTSTLRLKTADIIEKVIPALMHEPTIIDIPEETENVQ